MYSFVLFDLSRSAKSFYTTRLTKADARAKYNTYCEIRKSNLERLVKPRRPDRLEDESEKRWGNLGDKRANKQMREWEKLQLMHGHPIM